MRGYRDFRAFEPLRLSCQVVTVPAGCARDEKRGKYETRVPSAIKLRRARGHGEKAEEGEEKEDSRVASLGSICEIRDLFVRAKDGNRSWKAKVTRQSLPLLPPSSPAPSRSRPLFFTL